MPPTGPSESLFPILKNEIRSVRTALWFRPSAYCLLAALAAALLATLANLLPLGSLDWLPEVEVSTVQDLLKLLASGMLTVTAVTLSVLMLVLSLAAGQASPRAVPEVMADPVTQNALGTFVATFVYALAALLLFGFDAVSTPGVTLVFFGALALVLNAVRYLLQWIHHVAEVLKVNHIIHRIHRQGQAVLESYLESETAERCDEARAGKGQAHVVQPDRAGYIQLIDVARLHELACDADLVIRLRAQEGDFVHSHNCLMEVYGGDPETELLTKLKTAVVIGFDRSHEGDPRFGFELLAEVACRALSPGINDPQTALVCVRYLGSLLAIAGRRAAADYPADRSRDGRVQFLQPDFGAMLERAFRPVMRDGAGKAEVLFAIMGALKELAATARPDYLDCLLAESQRAESFGKAALQLDADKQTLVRMAEDLRQIAAERRA